MKNTIIVDKNNFEKILENLKKDWVSKLHILSDFDRTLTKAFANGKKRPSIISALRDQNILWEEYSKKAYKLFDYYHAIEIDPTISLEEKKKQMTIWWQKHLKLIVDTRLTKDDIKKAIKYSKIVFRKWVKDFLKKLNKYDIPLIIISANGLGWDSILYFLEKEKVLFNNIDIISNRFIWDKKGFAIWYKNPVIHVFNKDETVLQEFPEIYTKIKTRKNVILLWDSLWDPHMIKWFKYNNLLKIWFLNNSLDSSCPHSNPHPLGEGIDSQLLEEYKKNYDVVITWDGEFDFVNDILKEIRKNY